MTVSRKTRLLFFCRPYLAPDFLNCGQTLSAEFDFAVLTDGKSVSPYDTKEAFYRYMAAPSRPEILTSEELDDCIARCRLMRNLKRPEAERRVTSMAAALTGWFDRLKPDVTISHLVDDYVTHLVCILSRKRGLPFIAFFQSFFPGRIQLVHDEHGSPVRARQPEETEIETVIATIANSTYRQNFRHSSSYSFPRHLFRVGRYYVKRIYFGLKGMVENDRLQSHYAITRYIAERRRIGDYPRTSHFHADWRERLTAAAPSRPLAIYMPLGYFPEATTDYWVRNKSIIDYDNKMVEIAEALAPHASVVIKEHPHMRGIRSPALLKRLAAIKGVVLVHPAEFSTEVMQKCGAVILGGGSGGVEAVLQEMPIFSYCDTCYWFEPSGAQFLDLDKIDAWADTIRSGIVAYKPKSEAEKQAFIETCLSGTVTWAGGKIWPLPDSRQFATAIRTQIDAGIRTPTVQKQ